MSLAPVLTKRFTTNQPWKIANYEQLDGYDGLRKALTIPPDDIIAMVKDSNLRGRGGAGFPTGMKWQFIPQPKKGEKGKPHYVVVNADEGEPGTCRDLPLMMNDPHSMVEGIIIACYAVRANHAFVYIRGEAVHAIRRVTAAVEEAVAAGYLGDDILGSGFSCRITVHAGAGAYICGEETALLDSLEGRRGQPRLKPPFPATNGLYDAPTVVNNVGTLASVPYIVLGGADWFKKMGPEGSPGPCIYSLSGRVANPGQYEAPMGTTLRELLDMAGGMSRGKELKFWTPGGSSTPLFTAEHLDTPLDFDAAVKAGSMLGTSAVQIFDDRRLRRARHAEVERVLQARVLRQVHALPRGHVLVRRHLRAPRARRGHRGGLPDAAGPVRQHPRPLVLRPRRRCHQPRLVLDQVLPRGVRGAPGRRLPVRGYAGTRPGRSPLMAAAHLSRTPLGCSSLTPLGCSSLTPLGSSGDFPAEWRVTSRHSTDNAPLNGTDGRIK